MHDVVVIGATVAGLTAARRLASEGFDVVVLDPNSPVVSADTGHGVATAATIADAASMRAAYGDQAVVDQVRRNLTAIKEIHAIADGGALEVVPTGFHDHCLGAAVESDLPELRNLFHRGGFKTHLIAPNTRYKSPSGLGAEAFLVDPFRYAEILTAQARTAGSTLNYDVTVIRLNRDSGVSGVAYRDNLDWSGGPRIAYATAVIDTLGVSPWCVLAKIGHEQVAPTVRCRPREAEAAVTLLDGSPVWMIRPVGDEAVLVGNHSISHDRVATADQLSAWAQRELGAVDLRRGKIVIDPSDKGRPVVGVSGTPGGYYTRGNGWAELVNGTASGCWLAAVLMGDDDATKRTALPWLSRARAHLRARFQR